MVFLESSKPSANYPDHQLEGVSFSNVQKKAARLEEILFAKDNIFMLYMLYELYECFFANDWLQF